MATSKSNEIKIITTTTKDILGGLGITADIAVEPEESGEERAYKISLSGEGLGVLIGYHGETLNSMQIILSLITSKKLDRWVRLTLDAGDWREKRFESLSSMALRAAEKAVSTGEEVALPAMSPSDRRLVHLALKDSPNISSESSGEEGYRRVVIRPKS